MQAVRLRPSMPPQKSGHAWAVSMHSARPTAQAPVLRSVPHAHSASLLHAVEQDAPLAGSAAPVAQPIAPSKTTNRDRTAALTEEP